MITLTFIQISIFAAYIIFIQLKFDGPLSSISDSWYKLTGNKKWLFTAFCWGIGIPMLFQGGALFILSGTGLCFVGTAVDYNHAVPYIHYVGALVGILFAFAGLYFEYGNIGSFIAFITLSLLYIALCYFKPNLFNNPVWWIEIIAFWAISVALLAR